MSRWKAAAIHLSISAAIGLVAAILIFGVWYPPPYSRATGALELVALLLGVDLVLGPLLTFVVFKSGKKSLRFDLSVIVVMQACAFFYGMSVVVRARPAFIVGAIDRFTLVSASDIDTDDLAKGPPPFNRMSWTGPRLVGANLPTDTNERTDLLFSSVGGKDLEKIPHYYVDYSVVASAMAAKAKPLDNLYAAHPEAEAKLAAWLHSNQRDPICVVWLPIIARTDTTMLLDCKTGEPLDALPVDPW